VRKGAGFDIVSGGELQRVLAAGGDPGKIVFSGVGKSAAELAQALGAGIFCFNLESINELHRLNKVAGEMNKVAPISFRVNPNVDANTHPYISTGLKKSKFGIDFESAMSFYHEAATLPNISVRGINCHIGSQVRVEVFRFKLASHLTVFFLHMFLFLMLLIQLTGVSPFIAALEKLLELMDQLAKDGIKISHLDIGGGLGIQYKNEKPPAVSDYITALLKTLGRCVDLICLLI
jgi:diaminopimelate decarboxylase